MRTLSALTIWTLTVAAVSCGPLHRPPASTQASPLTPAPAPAPAPARVNRPRFVYEPRPYSEAKLHVSLQKLELVDQRADVAPSGGQPVLTLATPQPTEVELPVTTRSSSKPASNA